MALGAVVLAIIALLTACAAPSPAARYGDFDQAGVFYFRDAAAARAFYEDHGERLCARRGDDGEYHWKARLDPSLPPELVPAYLRWYRDHYPDDADWGLAPCADFLEVPAALLARHGRLWGGERFVFNSPTQAKALWEILREMDLVCLGDQGVGARGSPELELELVLAALEYWRRAGVLQLVGPSCQDTAGEFGIAPKDTPSPTLPLGKGEGEKPNKSKSPPYQGGDLEGVSRAALMNSPTVSCYEETAS